MSVVDGQNRLAGAPIAVGLDPFGIAADAAAATPTSGCRLGNDVVVLRDTAASGSGPTIYLSWQVGCQGVPLDDLRHRIFSQRLRPGGGAGGWRTCDHRTDRPRWQLHDQLDIPGPRDPGGPRTITVFNPALPALTASATRAPPAPTCQDFHGRHCRQPARHHADFRVRFPPYNSAGNGEVRRYKAEVGKEIWLSAMSINEAFFGKDARSLSAPPDRERPGSHAGQAWRSELYRAEWRRSGSWCRRSFSATSTVAVLPDAGGDERGKAAWSTTSAMTGART